MFLEGLDDSTNGESMAVPVKDKHGRDVLAVILTYTFAVGAEGGVELVSGAPPPRLIDEYNGEDPARSSIRKPSLLFDVKPGTDVILAGHAHPPRRGDASSVDVTLHVGPIEKTVRAYGVRAWKAGAFGGVSPGPARPVKEPVPLVYELAWGGYDDSDPAHIVAEPRNYVGTGVACVPRSLVGQRAAQLEDPRHPLTSSEPAPASFGPIHRHWQPRASFAGTYDQAWMQTKMPLLPDDFDARFHVSVPPDQWSPTPLRGDEPIEIRGATPEGLWRFRLPRISPGVSAFSGGRRQEHRAQLDTIVIDADARRVELSWHAAIPLPRKYEMLERVVLFEKRLA